MPPRRAYDSQDDIPEQYREDYVERDGKWILQLEGGDPYSKPLDEFNRILSGRDKERQQREELQKQLDAIRERLGGDISDEYLETIAKSRQDADEAEQQRLIAEKKFEEAAEKKYQRRVSEAERQIEQLKAQVEKSQSDYNDLLGRHKNVMIQDKLRQELLSAGADPKKLPFVLSTESEKWELDTESWNPVPIEWINGGREKVTATGSDGNPLSMSEHAKGLLREHPWLALESSGSGSSHQTNGTNGAYQVRESQLQGPQGHSTYIRLKEQAKKAGQELQILPG